MHFEEIFRALNKNKIRYLVIGGVAVNLYGHMRATMDLDLLISLDPENRGKFLNLMKALKFRSIKPDLAKKLLLGEYPPKQIKVVTFFRDEFELIDVFIQSPIDFEKAYKKRKIFRSKKLAISTIPYNLLISMKRKADREIDMFDVSYLEHARRLKKRAKTG
jgi:hypothetical protein